MYLLRLLFSLQTASNKKRSRPLVPEVYETDEIEPDIIDLTEENEKRKKRKKNDSFEVHFRGDTVFCNQYLIPTEDHS